MRAAAACRPGGVTDDVTGWRGPGSGDGERVVAESGQDVAGLADETPGTATWRPPGPPQPAASRWPR